jgi:hypothetical protein
MRGTTNTVRAAIFAVTISLLSACGGGHGGGSSSSGSASTPAGGINLQVVSFGDSLSDVGTYAPIASAVGGGRFTTNPGQVWTQNVAQYYGDTLSAAYTIDLTHELKAQGGFGYAEGGATVATPANQNDFLTDVIGNVEMPVNQQVSSYLSAHGSFNAAGWRAAGRNHDRGDRRDHACSGGWTDRPGRRHPCRGGQSSEHRTVARWPRFVRRRGQLHPVIGTLQQYPDLRFADQWPAKQGHRG